MECGKNVFVHTNCTNMFKYDGIGLVSNKCSIVLNSNSKYLVTRKHDKVVIGKL